MGLKAELHPLQESHPDTYTVTRKVRFPHGGVVESISSEALNLCLRFAIEMTIGAGAHRTHRTSGQRFREPAEVFENTLRGKIAEVVICNRFSVAGIRTEPDFTVAPLGEWDSGDVTVAGYAIQVKSTKSYGNLLLFECDDWQAPNEYRHGPNGQPLPVDALVLVRVKMPEIPKDVDLLSPQFAAFENLQSGDFQVDVPGYINRLEIEECIQSKNVIPRNALLNGKQKMDVSNYYVQAGDLKPIELLINGIKNSRRQTQVQV